MTESSRVRDPFTWSSWQPLFDSWRAGHLPDLPGLYRIRRVGRDDLDYIGQTGAGKMTLPQRAGMLRGVYADTMPYRDPHTAGPALWALRHATGADFEISVVPVQGDTPWRKGLECVAISLHRQEHDQSPTVNWGRMPSGYRMSSGNNAHLVMAGRRTHGGLTAESDESHLPSIAPVDGLAGDPLADDWCGHHWSSWKPTSIVVTTAAIPAAAAGLYRIRHPDVPGLLYIGQGRIRSRLAAHARKPFVQEHRQADIFAGLIEWSWVLNDAWYAHQRLELENDLIAAHVLTLGVIPLGQFLG